VEHSEEPEDLKSSNAYAMWEMQNICTKASEKERADLPTTHAASIEKDQPEVRASLIKTNEKVCILASIFVFVGMS
jgi:hypothetical protein